MWTLGLLPGVALAASFVKGVIGEAKANTVSGAYDTNGTTVLRIRLLRTASAPARRASASLLPAWTGIWQVRLRQKR